eukprot:CAMPEP_0172157504 /NCGR_PEP_ID=MMETSP1050-20130122/3825_1 /TAXON_ID=233186 /ORGANISM="Cryptomonas curvata, Strain CCAP979/52" /LENGTH=127 /DNA_ID=CAMNT_0012826735 /DNA_START=227 /DNA_END=607 /DNA_ORIENTATION=-
MVKSLSSALNELECEVLGTQIESLCTQYARSVPTVRQAVNALAEVRNGRQLLSMQSVDPEQVLDDLLNFQDPSDPDNSSIGTFFASALRSVEQLAAHAEGALPLPAAVEAPKFHNETQAGLQQTNWA